MRDLGCPRLTGFAVRHAAWNSAEA